MVVFILVLIFVLAFISSSMIEKAFQEQHKQLENVIDEMSQVIEIQKRILNKESKDV